MYRCKFHIGMVTPVMARGVGAYVITDRHEWNIYGGYLSYLVYQNEIIRLPLNCTKEVKVVSRSCSKLHNTGRHLDDVICIC